MVSFPVLAQDSTAVIVDSSIAEQDTVIEKKVKKKVAPMVAKRRKNSGWGGNSSLFFIGLGVFLLFGVVRFFYNKYIHALFSTLGRSALWRLSSNERLLQNWSVRYLFLALYFLSAGYIIGQIIVHYYSAGTAMQLWMWGTAVAFGIYFFKYLVLQAVAIVFRFKKIADDFFKHIMVINQVLGLVLLPICGLLLVVPLGLKNILLIITILILVTSLIFKFLVNVAHVRNLSKVNYMHFMVYLCTLEFIPLAVLARYVYSGMGV